MTLADAYRRLGTVLSGLEADGIEVVDVTPVQDDSGDVLHVDVRVGIPTAADAPEPTIGVSSERGRGAVDAAVAGGSDTDSADGADDVDGPDADAESDAAPDAGSPSGHEQAAYPCEAPDCGAGFDSAAALTVHWFVAHDRPDESIHKHEPALRAAYDAYDSFSTMTDALGADVTPQTVRRNMLKFGIHELDTADDGAASAGGDGAPSPGGSDPGDDAVGETDGSTGAAEERPVTDGAGSAVAAAPDPEHDGRTLETLPDDIDVAVLREAVVEGGSLRAAARRLDRSRGATRDLLRDHDLLDLVHGRVATRPGREERADAFEQWLDDQRGGVQP